MKVNTDKQDALSQDLLKDLLRYNPETGEFRWAIVKRGCGFGKIAGFRARKDYRRIRINGEPYQAHRLAWLYMYGDWPIDQLDHINGNKDDNRIINLRSVSHLENHRNQKLRSTNTSGVMGVSWHKPASKWQAQVKVKGESIHLGSFSEFADAVAARQEANVKYGYHPNHGR